ENRNLVRILSVLFLFLTLSARLAAQNSFSGVVTDAENETLPGVQVLLFAGDSLYAGGLTDRAGAFSLRDLQAGDYLLRIHYPGYTGVEENRRIKGVMKYQFTLLKEMTVELDAAVEVTDYKRISEQDSMHTLRMYTMNSPLPPVIFSGFNPCGTGCIWVRMACNYQRPKANW
ncbi:MAG: carboxypeptidase-like regulatory domain-containing protein, partial [Tannerellaceae bacterium]|nr:carboxypeptidase-like regulatory domain-containing protein [Tannerellaceae bacterium]